LGAVLVHHALVFGRPAAIERDDGGPIRILFHAVGRGPIVLVKRRHAANGDQADSERAAAVVPVRKAR
jgi:hypothetical protein